MSTSWPAPITAVTLFVEDLPATRSFYEHELGLPVHFADADSAVFTFGSVLVNLLRIEAAAELIEPVAVGPAAGGARAMITVTVDDVDAVCEELRGRGVALLNGPIDRPWGVRTAAFADPAGHVWELAS